MTPPDPADDAAASEPDPDIDGGSGEDWLEISIEAEAWSEGRDIEALARRAVAAALEEAGFAPEQAVVSLLFTNDAAIRDLNQRFRAKDAPTNVLSWPSLALDGPAAPGDLGPAPAFLGDVALAFETIAAEAVAQGKPLEDHIAHLIIHGVLHLLGYDHEDEGDAALMEAREISALGRIGVASPYEEAHVADGRQDWE